jgi:hypothetical protein
MVIPDSSQKDPNESSLIRSSWRLINYLKSNAKYGESLENVIWRLLGQKILTKEEAKGVKAKFEDEL